MAEKIIPSFSNLDKTFENAEIKKQSHILSSLFPEKLDFDGEQHRTPRTNVIANAIWLINNLLHSNKKGKTLCLEELSLGVVSEIQDSNYFIVDLRNAAGLEDDLFNPLPPGLTGL